MHAKNVGHNIKEIHADNCGEFNNQAVHTVLKKCGFSQSLMVPFTPEMAVQKKKTG